MYRERSVAHKGKQCEVVGLQKKHVIHIIVPSVRARVKKPSLVVFLGLILSIFKRPNRTDTDQYRRRQPDTLLALCRDLRAVAVG